MKTEICCFCLEKKELLNHHISYDPDITIRICIACHGVFHGTWRLKPGITGRHYPKKREKTSPIIHISRKNIADKIFKETKREHEESEREYARRMVREIAKEIEEEERASKEED